MIESSFAAKTKRHGTFHTRKAIGPWHDNHTRGRFMRHDWRYLAKQGDKTCDSVTFTRR